jgi:type II secretory pathway component PulJ
MQGMIDMALLPIEESTGKKKYTGESSKQQQCWSIVYAAHKQTNTSATMRRRVGARVQKKMLE